MVEFNRIKLSADATSMLKTLQTRTGITPNIICRFALCYSLDQSIISDLVQIKEDGMEISRHTLFGDNEVIYISLVKEKCKELGLDPEKDFMKIMKTNINNGIITIFARVKGLEDFINLIENE